MNHELKKQLQLLQEQYPELSNSSLSFANGDITLKIENDISQLMAQANDNGIIEKTGYHVDIIAGHSGKVEVRSHRFMGMVFLPKRQLKLRNLLKNDAF